MHSVTVNIGDSDYKSFLEFVKSRKYIEIIEDSELENREDFIDRINSSKDDIKDGRVSDFDFNSFVNELDNEV